MSPKEQGCQWGQWQIRSAQSHILTKDQEETFSKELRLPHIPDMTFANNILELKNESEGLCLKFVALDALKTVDATGEKAVKVAMSESWLEARQESAHLHQIVHNFDWTYTPFGYKGTTTSDKGVEWQPTDNRIDYEKLKEMEKILFFDDVILFEDELDDNGCSKLSVKIRAMPSGFFILMRFYLRVDNTLIRVIDSRIYHQRDSKTILREYIEREDKVNYLQVPASMWTDQNEIVNHLTLRTEIREELKY